ncbi:alkyl hydroperoxide reductase subunit F [Pseudoalteromonas luteoviolacea]|uniref:Alkyl hydroperoxide reductase subunit F n=1 Tax=Pseudoalteromonas luteoviolacea TaxID=43657 RepID=A0A1C0TSF4_9GAMM|nr:alkyl hydroperoxide reductase subunit F [Pseudoalteromonas luteoviolacea]OCQ22189.1 alkyl hydroperoxide reductase subunit F [Pseudoalteromonas luteoviolacea]
MLDAQIKSQLQEHFKQIKSPIELKIALDNSNKSDELNSLAQDLVSLSAHISVVENYDMNARRPSLVINAKDTNTQISFAGVPMGHEFTSLVLALLHAGGHPSKLSKDELDVIHFIDQPMNFEVYVSLSCQTCPQVVQALNTLAANNANISTTMIDGALFQDEVDERSIMAVPSVYLNGELFSQGAVSLSDILKKLDGNSAQKEVEKLNDKAPFDVLVIGGGPAGASAAVYAARKGLNTGVVAERFGGQVADTMSIENFISVKETEGPKLVAQLEQHVKQYDVDIMGSNKVANIERNEYLDIELENGATLKAKSVVISTGARWRSVNVPGEAEYKGRGVAYCPHCDGPLFKGKPVAVIGGGNSGIEAAIDLANITEHVTVLEFASELKADQVLIDKAKSLPNITIHTNVQTTEIAGDDQKVTGLHYLERDSGQQRSITVAGVFVQIGLVPNSEWLQGSDVELNRFGEIEIDNKGSTSMQGVFAAGDVTISPFKQIVIAMGSGATASLGAFDYLIRTQDSVNQAA